VKVAAALAIACICAVARPAAAGDDATLADAAARVRAAKMRDAALRSIDAAIALLAEEIPTPRQQALDMLADPGAHRLRAESQRALRAREQERLRQAFREQLGAFARERAAELPPAWVDDVMTHEKARVDSTIDRLLVVEFDDRYEEARRRAVRMQRGQLDEVLYPTGADIEALAGPPAEFAAMRSEAVAALVTTANGRALVDEYVNAISSDTVLFEENEAVLEQHVGRAINEALVLLWRQLRLVHRTEPEGSRERSEIAARIHDDLAQLAAEAERVSGTSYGVFPSAERAAIERAEQLETTGFVDFLTAQLDGGAGCPGLPPGRVLEHAGSSYEHVPPDLATHERQLEEALLARTQQDIVEAYTASVTDAATRVPLRTRLEGLIRTNPAIQRPFSSGFTTCLRAPLKQRRMELATQELAAREPGMADFSFELADGALRWIEVNRLDAPGGPFATPAALRLEETSAIHRAHREQLAAEAKDVLWRQKALTRDPERKASFVAQIEADRDRSDERKAYWQEAYERSVLGAWEEVRTDELLKNDDGTPYHPHKYARVLGPVSDIIGEIITLEFGRTAQIVTQAQATDARQATSEPVPAVAATPGTAEAPVASGGAGGPATGPATGETPMPQEGGQLARAAGPSTQRSSGGGGGSGGGGPDCATLLERCSAANAVCYEALGNCKNDPATCDAGVARCREVMTQCEEGRAPLVPEGEAHNRPDDDLSAARCLAGIGFPSTTSFPN
jgi:hypothetical protein